MIGVVLCGGESRRMGTDKGLLQTESISWAELASNRFHALNIPVVLSVNDRQYSLYAKTFQSSVLIKDNTTLSIGGPLKGILSVHLYNPYQDLLVIACDMLDINSIVIEELINAKATNKAEAFAFRNEEHIEPLCTVYTAEGLRKVHDQYSQKKLERFSLHYVLGLLNTYYLPVPPQWKIYFNNYNSPQDLPSK